MRLPAALTYIFAGLKVSIVFAATGAIVGEFVGANAGLGYIQACRKAPDVLHPSSAT